jgi:chromosome segregation ATPase
VAAPRPEALDPRAARVDVLCDKLLAELRGAPDVLREVVHQPEPTVEALRRSCHELVRRERELRALSSPEDEKRLTDEREQLAARVAAERDAVVKERLGSALEVLDEQRRQRAELGTAASRLEAEYTRLYYTLEHLYAQVLRVRSADTASADVAGAGLRKSLEQLGTEMDAVAEALEDAHRTPPETRVRSR